jgi:hypothetical protein
MDKHRPKDNSMRNVVRAAGRFGNAGTDLVQMKAQLPMRAALMEASIIMGCITEITHKAIDKPGDRKVMMQATYYLAGMAKALIDGQHQQIRDEQPSQGEP